MDEVLRKNLGVHQTHQGGSPLFDCLTKETGLEWTGEPAVLEKVLQLEFQHLDKMGKRQE